jgi:peptidoglycan/LPS O-acetylase OafA/YrhL
MNFIKYVTINIPATLDFLLIVRGLVAISVVYWHYEGYLIRDDSYFISFFVMPGRLAVWIFFMMSGYLIGHGLIYGRYHASVHGIYKFFYNRILRIYPIFFIVSIVCLVARILILNEKVDPWNYTFIFRQFFMYQWNHDYALNGVFWTLGLETQLYLIAPLLIFGFGGILKGSKLKWVVGYFTILLLLWSYNKTTYFSNWDLRNVWGGYRNLCLV